MTYGFKWRRIGSFFFTVEKGVIGHGYLPAYDKFVIRYSGGYMKEIPQWSKCEFRGGPDYHVIEQEALNKAAGQVVPINKL